MGLKSFTNSHNGRVSLALSGMILLALLISGGVYTYLIYYPQSTRATLQNELKQASSSWNVRELKVVDEPQPLAELPSTTLNYLVNPSPTGTTETLSTSAVGFPFIALSNKKLDSLLNVSASFESTDSPTSEANYSFKFYSASLKDYEDGGAYQDAAEQFLVAKELGLDNIEFVSKPSPTGGREVTLNSTAQANFKAANAEQDARVWNELVRGLTNEANFQEGTLINLKLSDPEKITVKTTLASSDDAERATNFLPSLWSTFSSYAYETPLSFVKATKVEYTVERTPEDSTLLVTVDPEGAAVPDLQNKIYSAAVDSDTLITVLWSYNTYFVTADNPAPFLTLESTSRNW